MKRRHRPPSPVTDLSEDEAEVEAGPSTPAESSGDAPSRPAKCHRRFQNARSGSSASVGHDGSGPSSGGIGLRRECPQPPLVAPEACNGSAPGVARGGPASAASGGNALNLGLGPEAVPPARMSFEAAVAQLTARVQLLEASPILAKGQSLIGFIECFSGSETLTQVWREAGHRVFPMDITKSAEHDMADLGKGGALLLTQCAAMIRATGKKPVVHFAPPCCTYSVARFPKIRTRENPHGLPASVLNPLERKTLAYANRVTTNSMKIMKVLAGFGIPVHFEQPVGSLMQRERCFRSWAANSGAAKFVVDYCCFGAPFRKSAALWSSPPWLLTGLAKRCPGDHEHTVTLSRWGVKGCNLATGAGSSAYPAQLCRAWRAAVLANLENFK